MAMVMEAGQLQQFERYCTSLYTSTNESERKEAEMALVTLSGSTAYLPQCQYVLDNSREPCAPNPPRRRRARPLASGALRDRTLPPPLPARAGTRRWWRQTR